MSSRKVVTGCGILLEDMIPSMSVVPLWYSVHSQDPQFSKQNAYVTLDITPGQILKARLLPGRRRRENRTACFRKAFEGTIPTTSFSAPLCVLTAE